MRVDQGVAEAGCSAVQTPPESHARAGATAGNRWLSRRRASRLPLAAVIAWWLGTFLVYLSPWPLNYWHVNVGWVAVLWLACCLGLTMGWFYGESLVPRRATRPVAWLPWVGLLLSWLLLPVLVRSYSAFSIFDLGRAIADQRAAYLLASDVIAGEAAQRRLLTVLVSVANLAILTSVPWFALAWISRGSRGWALALSAAPSIILAILSGRDSALGPLVIVVASAVLVAIGTRSLSAGRGAFLATAALLGLAFMFAWRRIARANVSGYVYSTCSPGTDCTEAVLPTDFLSGLHGALGYASMGFEGLGHALNAQWVFGGGYSHSAALTGLLGSPSLEVVQEQLDSLGWSSLGLWSTSLSWIANDVPFAMIPLLMVAVGAFVSRVWADATRLTDPINLTVFAYSMYVLIYMPLNFTIGASGPVYVAFLGLVLLWALRGLIPGRRYIG